MSTAQPDQPLRVLHLPDLVGGHPTALCAGERELGLASETLSIFASPFGYHSDTLLKRQNGGQFFRWLERTRTFGRIRNDYDVFHFNFGSSLLNAKSGKLKLVDLPFYSRSARKFMTYQGSDARLAYGDQLDASADAERRLGNHATVDSFLAHHDKTQSVRRAVIEKAATHCDHMFVLNPDLMDFMPKGKASFLPYAIEDCSKIVQDHSVTQSSEPDRKLPRNGSSSTCIVHLSTNRLLKGTGLIETALSNLTKDHSVTFECVLRQSRERALDALRKADIVIDQMVLGWYGAAAVEAMYLGKPVIGYIDETFSQYVPMELLDDLPIVRSDAAGLENAIMKVLANPNEMFRLGQAGRKFALKWHSPNSVAKRVVKYYTGLKDA